MKNLNMRARLSVKLNAISTEIARNGPFYLDISMMPTGMRQQN